MNNEQYLFNWDEIQGKDDDQLKEFLTQTFSIDWIKTAKIQKEDDGRTIMAYSKKNCLSLSLNPEKTRVSLKIDDCSIGEFIVRSEFGKLNIYSERIDVTHLIQCKVQILREYLDDLKNTSFWAKLPGWRFSEENPVRIKNMEKIIGHLQSILYFLDMHTNTAGEGTSSLICLLNQIKEPEKISSNNAWELADLLEIEITRHGDDAYLYMLLKAQAKLESPHKWDVHFSSDYLDTLLKRYNCGKFLDCYGRLEARHFLEYLQYQQVLEYRRDRAKAQLRGTFLGYMALSLSMLIGIFSYFYLKASSFTDFNLFLVVLSAGAIGSVLSRAIKLSKQPLHSESGVKTTETPLGIRVLISESKQFRAQIVIGAAAALIIFLVFSWGVITIKGIDITDKNAYTVLAFLAGFSEPFFIGILDKVAGKAGSSLR